MKKYGLRIGNVGVEFYDQLTREKALLAFTKGGCVEICDYAGRRYSDSQGAFSTYERESEEQTMNCDSCKGSFSSETCTLRDVPAKSYDGKFKGEDITEKRYLCDACYAKLIKEFELHKAQKIIDAG